MDYVTHWLLTAAGAFLLLICGFASQFLVRAARAVNRAEVRLLESQIPERKSPLIKPQAAPDIRCARAGAGSNENERKTNRGASPYGAQSLS